MKLETIKLRIAEDAKLSFQAICDNKNTTMSNRILDFIEKDIKLNNRTSTQKLFKFDVINGNNRIYRKSELLKILLDEDGFEITELERINKKPMYGQFGYANDDTIIHKYNATHTINNIRIDGDWLIGDVTILNEVLLPILNNLVFRPRSYGKIDKKMFVYDLEIIGFDAILKSDDSFLVEP